MNASAVDSNCKLCENPYPYMCNQCNAVIAESEPVSLPTLSELAASIPAMAEHGVSYVRSAAKEGLSSCRHARQSLGMAAKNPHIVKTWVGSGEDFPFPYSPIGD